MRSALTIVLCCIAVLTGCSKDSKDKTSYTIKQVDIDARDTADMLGLRIYKFQLGVPAGWYYVMLWVDSESGATGKTRRMYLSQIVHQLEGNDHLRVMVPAPGKEGIAFSIGQNVGQGPDRCFYQPVQPI
jgi:hypothetical protein